MGLCVCVCARSNRACTWMLLLWQPAVCMTWLSLQRPAFTVRSKTRGHCHHHPWHCFLSKQEAPVELQDLHPLSVPSVPTPAAEGVPPFQIQCPQVRESNRGSDGMPRLLWATLAHNLAMWEVARRWVVFST